MFVCLSHTISKSGLKFEMLHGQVGSGFLLDACHIISSSAEVSGSSCMVSDPQWHVITVA